MARVDLCDLHVFGPILVCLAPVINLVLNLVPVLVPVYMAKYQNTKIPRHLLRVSTVHWMWSLFQPFGRVSPRDPTQGGWMSSEVI
jgi:hypothetical protein